MVQTDRTGEYVGRVVTEAARWTGVESGPHRFGGTEFRLGPREVGHVHRMGIVDVAFPKRVRDVLVAEGRTGPHHIYPESGWTTLTLQNSDDVDRAIWLLRLSYLSHVRALSRTGAGRERFSGIDVDAELAELDPSDDLRAAVEG